MQTMTSNGVKSAAPFCVHVRARSVRSWFFGFAGKKWTAVDLFCIL